jgi:hypothetical protein
MRILLEICLTICEWIQEASILRSARRAARRYEKKTIFTFLSQAALGGKLGLFVLVTYSVMANPSGYNFVMLVGLPIYSLGGAAAGAFAGVLIWLLEASLDRLRFAGRENQPARASGTGMAILYRSLRFVGRTIIGMVVIPWLLLAFYCLVDKRELDQLSYSWWLGFSCTMGLLIGLITGSTIRPCRTIVFGAEGRPARRNFGSWLAIPFGFLLRALSVFGLLEALMVMALWYSNRSVDRDWFPTREHLPAVVFAVFYFAASAYFSIRSPRKIFLLPIAIVLNVPLAFWIADLISMGSENSIFLSYSLRGFVSLWAVYTFGRMIAPESPRRVFNSRSETQEVIPGAAAQVQLRRA